jgi:formate dehydrogenase (coenzyme F420) beta subunit
MNNHLSLDTRGDPLGTLRGFIKNIWMEAGLDGMLVTIHDENGVRATPRYITDVALMDGINPFKPLMEVNAARLIPGLLADHPGSRIGALLRPCEIRALTEMTKHLSLSVDNLLTISVDCLGTLPADEYQWRLERIEKSLPVEDADIPEPTDELAREALRFARQGGIVPYRYRSACQVCSSPAATQSQVNIHILGLPVRQHMLVTYSETPNWQYLRIEKLVDGRPGEELVAQHDRMLAKMSERHQRTMERLNEALGGLLPVDVDAVIRVLESCGNCHKCMDACPICSVDSPERHADGHYDRIGVMRWLVSCAGCGMCEQACPNHMPVAALFAHIRRQLAQEWQYIPGRSGDDPLPLISL